MTEAVAGGRWGRPSLIRPLNSSAGRSMGTTPAGPLQTAGSPGSGAAALLSFPHRDPPTGPGVVPPGGGQRVKCIRARGDVFASYIVDAEGLG